MSARAGRRPASALRLHRPRFAASLVAARAARAARSAPAGLLAAATLVALPGPGAAQSQAAGYRIVCSSGDGNAVECAADLTTYIGWRVFDRYCAGCHAPDAEGSSFAPSLLQRIRALDRRAFDAALDRGYTGPAAPLPPWGEHPQVARYYDELWTYLRARANGDVSAGALRPLRAAEAEDDE